LQEKADFQPKLLISFNKLSCSEMQGSCRELQEKARARGRLRATAHFGVLSRAR
jgi:hypothetical protein